MTGGTDVWKVLDGHRRLFAFFFGDGWRLLVVLADAWDKPKSRLSAGGTAVVEYRIPRAIVDRYNSHYEDLKATLRAVGPDRGLFGRAFILPMVAVRAGCAVVAAAFGWVPMAAFSVLQFAVAPYSFFAAVAAWYHVLPLFMTHFVMLAIIQSGTSLVVNRFPAIEAFAYVSIDLRFILWWFVIDQLTCVLFCLWTPNGRPVRYPPGRLLQSWVYGFLNCKTYWLVLLFACQGFRIDLLAWTLLALVPSRAVAYVSGLLRPLLRAASFHWTFQSSMFYHSHRLVHLPCVYPQSHRHHHYLHDATPFDADLYGSGLPEEWMKLLTETVMCMVFGLMPWSLSFSALQLSVRNRIGHTRTDAEAANFHVNHHATHVRNFGVRWFPVDLLMGTEHKDVSVIGHGIKVTRRVDRDDYVLVITELEPAAAA
jgi:hypothetical protein